MNAIPQSAIPGELGGYLARIHEATGAPRHLLGLIETIMRRDVFRSTLDWQTAAEFARGARRAYALYRRDAAFYDAEFALNIATHRMQKAEQVLAAARAGDNASALALAEVSTAAARADYSAAEARLNGLLASCPQQ